ncbi:MAG TPA: tripartite tricarboxylate transporter TctB family protein [Burkholderiaceae bacterium]|nr:tripartite tricarboxylate transporter TctB family protein [Burkholderiaceae bacterium]
MSDRIFGVLLVAAAAAVALLAQGIEATLSYEPVGPRAWPLVLAILLAGTGVMLTLRAIDGAAAPVFPRGVLANKVLAMVAAIGAYAVMFEPLGFALSTWLLTVTLGRIFEGRWPHVIIGGGVLGIGLYYAFDRLLDVTLPGGPLGFGAL